MPMEMSNARARQPRGSVIQKVMREFFDDPAKFVDENWMVLMIIAIGTPVIFSMATGLFISVLELVLKIQQLQAS